jgi:hypothetical protein
MSDRFLIEARNHTEQWEDYVSALHRLGEAVVEVHDAFLALADARDALRCAVDQKETVNG